MVLEERQVKKWLTHRVWQGGWNLQNQGEIQAGGPLRTHALDLQTKVLGISFVLWSESRTWRNGDVLIGQPESHQSDLGSLDHIVVDPRDVPPPEMANRHQVTLEWLSVHSGVRGSKKVDELARSCTAMTCRAGRRCWCSAPVWQEESERLSSLRTQ